jgi:beta-lactamase superfamily II metal-dependent hydrolase
MKKRVFYVILGLLAGVFIMAGMTQLTKKQATDTADTPNTVDKQGGLLFHLVPVHVGDGLVFELPTGEVVLIDGGGSDTEVLDHAYCSDVLSYLKERGIKKIDVAIATHQDYDHVLGLWCIGQDPDITINKLYYNNDLRPVIHF